MSMIFSLLKSEHLKARHNFGVWLLLLFPLVATVANACYVLYDAQGRGELYANPWIFTVRFLFQLYTFLYPLLIAIMSFSMFDIDYRHSNFKRLFILPASRSSLLKAKLLYLCEVITLSVLGACASFWLTSFILSVLLPGFKFGEYEVRAIVTVYFLKFYFIVLVLASIHYCLSCLFKRFSVVLGIACFGVIFSLIASQWEYIVYSPYHYLYRIYQDFTCESTEGINEGLYINAGYLLISLILLFNLYAMNPLIRFIKSL